MISAERGKKTRKGVDFLRVAISLMLAAVGRLFVCSHQTIVCSHQTKGKAVRYPQI